jgi:pimeloyl-ACP methyl ester carboxylesterase
VAGPEGAPPVLILPGGNFLNPLCLAWFAPLARQHRVFAPDIVGQPGRSAQRRLSPKGDEQAAWTADVVDGLGLVEAAFVGISYGAGIILRLGGYAPSRITRAALVSPAGVALGPVPRMLKDVMVPMLIYRLLPNPERLRRAASPILTDLDDLYVRQLGAVYRGVKLDRGLPRLATEEELTGLDAPVLLFASEYDLFFPGEKVMARARKIIPNLEAAELLEGCRHVPSREVLRRLNSRLLAFLSKAEG